MRSISGSHHASCVAHVPPYQATTAAPLPERQGSAEGHSSCPGSVLRPGWWSRALRQRTRRPATVSRGASARTRARAAARSRALREEGELVCNRVTPVGYT